MSDRPATRLWLLSFIGFWALFAGWAFASPYNGPPDEELHAIRAAGVMRGELLPPQDPKGGTQLVPKSLDREWCFPQKVTVPASCVAEPGGDETLARVHTTAARYNPVYYAVTAWPLRFWPSWPGIVLSRLLNGAAMAALLACAMVAAVRWVRNRALVTGVVVAVTPMIAHLGGAINPNGVEIAAGVSLFAALIALLYEQREGINRAAVALAGVSGAVMVTPRFIGAAWFVLILFVMLVPSSKARLRELARSGTVRRWSVVVVVATVASVAWTLVASTVAPTATDHGMSLMQVLRSAIVDDMWPNVANQMVGVMGWAETLMPRVIYVGWFMAAGLLLLGGLALGRRVDRWRLLALFFGTFTPLLGLELLTANSVGWFNQGRYFLTGAVGLPMLATYVMALNRLTGDQIRSITRMLAVILLPIHLVCLAYSMSRWESGLVSLNPFNGSWHPPYGVALPLALEVLGVALLYVLFFRTSRAPAKPAVEEEQHLVGV
jgi:hypothetical protein